LETRQVDATPRIETHSLSFQEVALRRVRFTERPWADLAAGIDHAVPRDRLPGGHGVEGVAHLSRVTGEPRQPGDLTVGRDAPARNPSDDCVDLRVAGTPILRHERIVTQANPRRHSGRRRGSSPTSAHPRILEALRATVRGGRMPEPVVRVEKDGAIAIVTLNRPEAMNALSRALREALARAFEDLANDPDTAIVVLTGAGRAFCAGFDLKELSSESTDAIAEVDVIGAIRAFEGPIIGAVNGHAVTGGFELALACDVLIASTTAKFADTHARVGILPGWGLSQILPRVIGLFRAKEMSLTGNFVPAEQAEAWGIVNRVVAPEELLPACMALATDMLSCDRTSLRGYKRLIDRGFGLPFAEAMRFESEVSREVAKTISSETVARRRSVVQDRGRSQTSG